VTITSLQKVITKAFFGGFGNDRIIATGTGSVIDGGSGFDIAYVNSIYSAKYRLVAEGDHLRPAIEINGNIYMGIDEFRIGYTNEQNFEHIYTPGSGSFTLSWAQMIDYIYSQKLDTSAQPPFKGTVGSISENVELDVLYRYNLKENPNFVTLREIVDARMTIPGTGSISLIVDHIGDELVLRAPQGVTVDAEVAPYVSLYLKFAYRHALKGEFSTSEFTTVEANLAVLNVYDNAPTHILTDATSYEIHKDFEDFKISLAVDRTDIDHRAIVWEIASDPSSLFFISGNQLMLKGYDYVKFKDPVTVSIKASDGKTTVTKDLTFSVQNTAPNLSDPVFETTTSYFDVGATLLTIPFSDDHDSVDDLVWEIVENPFNENGEPSIPHPDDPERDPLFAIVGNKVILLRAPNQSELGTSIGISIKVTDRSGASSEKKVVVKLPSSSSGGGDTGENPGGGNGSTTTTYGTQDDDMLTGTSSPDVIYGLGGNDIIIAVGSGDTLYGGDGDDILVGDIDSVLYGEDGNDTLVATAAGHLYGGNGDDTFDISNVMPGVKTGILDGGSGHDIVYINDLSSSKLTLTGQTVNLLINGFQVSGVEEFRIGWERDANGTWHEAANSQTLSYWDLFAKAAEGQIEGLNAGWKNISVAAVDESLEQTSDRVIVFQGELKSPLPNGIVISDAMITINGINYAAEVTITNEVYTITLPKFFFADVAENTIFEGGIYSKDANNVFFKQMGFTGLIRDIYDLQRAPSLIIGDTYLDASEVDILEPYQFSVDNFNQDKPITWSISGSGSEFFTISNDGLLSSIGTLDFSVPYDLVIRATDGVKTVIKYVYVEAYNPVNIIWGTSGDDIIYGTAQDDIIHGLDGDDIIYAGGGFDTVYGGAGNDTLIATDFYADLYGEDGDDILIGSHRGDYLFGGDGNDILYGGGHKDRMWGGAGADVFVYKDVTDSDYYNLNLSDRIFDLEDDDAFDFTEMGDVSFDWDNGPAGSLYVEVNWQPYKQYGYLSIDVDRDGVFDMAIDFDAGAAGLTQINFVNGPTYYLDDLTTMRTTSTAMVRLMADDLLVTPVVDNAPDVYHQYQWAA